MSRWPGSRFLPIVVAVGCGGCTPTEAPTLTRLRADVFQPRCGAAACHGSDNPARGLDLVTDPHGALVDVASVVDPARRYVVAGEPDESLLLAVLRGPVPSPGGDADCRQMPPGFVLPNEILADIEAWIDAGAPDD